jgi:DNA polymerase (family 10)
MENREVAKILQETAQLLEIDGAIIGRYRTYEKVAELLFGMHERIEEIAKDDAKLRELPGVGENMAAHIREVLKTGDYALRQKAPEKVSAHDPRAARTPVPGRQKSSPAL